MKYRQLGRSGPQISVIGLGCMSLPADQKEAVSLIGRAADEGINLLDTADIYQGGENEKNVGAAIRALRQKFILASKVGNVARKDGSGLDWNPSRKHILSAVEASLERLQTDYIDLYQLHGGTIQDNIDETIETFELLKQQGKIRFYGISSIRPNVIREYLAKSSISSVMMQYSLLDRRPEESCLDAIHHQGVGVLVRGGLAQGLLAGKPAKPYLGLTQQQVQQAADAAAHSGRIALQYVLGHPAVSCAVVGMRTPRHLADAIQWAEGPPLSSSETDTLKFSVQALKYTDHRT